MKRINNIYNQILDIKVIENIYKKIKTNTKNKTKIEKFEDYYVENIINIKNIISLKKYKFDKYSIFIIKEPKLRLIMSQTIKDKLINHIISEYFLVRIFDKTLINENIATRKNKGTHYGIKLLKKYLNEIKYKNFYILKFDISKYFFNIDHEILKKLIRKKIKDKDVLNVLDLIIDSTNYSYINEEINKLKIKDLPNYKKGKGLPIGNMSSQIFAIIYLNELDHYIKENLKIKYYIRYMDDGIILHENKEYLKYCLKEIEKIVKKYELELNNKTCILNIKQGFEFLGFKYYIKNNKVLMKVKNQTKRKFKRKMKKLNNLLNENKISEKKVKQVKDSYLGHLSYGNTNNLIYKELKKYIKSINIGQEVRIINENVIYMSKRIKKLKKNTFIKKIC